MEELKNKIAVYSGTELIKLYTGNLYIFREDFIKEGCVHFRDEDGKHHRIYGGTVLVDEE